VSGVPPWAGWTVAALCVLALGALLEAPRVRDRVLMVDRGRLRGALVRARLRGTPEPLLPFFRDLEEGAAGLVMGAAVSAMLFPSDELIFCPSQETRSGVVNATWGSSPYASITSRPIRRL